MRHKNVQKLALAGVFTAVAVVGSTFSFWAPATAWAWPLPPA